MLPRVLLQVIEAALPINASMRRTRRHRAIGEMQDGVIRLAFHHFRYIRIA